jgi:serine/threonine-protein kinase
MTPDDDSADSAPTSAGMGPSDETILLPPAVQAGPAHAWSKEEPQTEPLRQSWRLTWGHAAVLLACTGVVALAIGFVGWAVVHKHDDTAAPLPTTNPPASWAAPPPPAWMPTTLTPIPRAATTTAQLSISSLPGTDDLGWTAYPGARCDSGNQPVVMARTNQSVVVVCQIQPGNFYYRGVRLSDGARIELANAVRSSDGFDVTNPTDGTHYRIRATSLTIAPPDGAASSEPMLKYASN